MRKTYYTLIMYFVKLDMAIKSMTNNKYKGAQLYQEVKCYSHSKTCVILEEDIQYKFPVNLAVTARKWLNVKSIEKDAEMVV